MADYWSYNGYTLPRLPAGWDMQKYPYAIILGVKSAFGFNLVCHSELPTVRTVNGENVIGFNVGTKVYSFTFNRATDTDWVDKGEVTPTPSGSDVTWNYYDNDVTEWVWCNNDIKNESGNTVYSASVPVPISPEEPEEPETPETPAFDLTAWLTGYALGLCGKPLPFSKAEKEPIAYLYNGVRLPDINAVWTDKETYPCACIDYDPSTDRYHLYYGKAMGTRYPEYDAPGTAVWDYILFDDYFFHYRLLPGASEWELFTERASGIILSDGTSSDVMVWTNTDILNEDGSVFLAASEPIPVYE